MDIDHLNLLRIRIASEIDYIRTHQSNSTDRISILLNSLAELMEKIVGVSFSSIDNASAIKVFKQLTTIETVLEYVKHTSTSNLFGEIFSCLRIALEEWSDESDKYAMVTGPGNFAFTKFIPEFELEVIIPEYMAPFPVMPARFNLPSHLEHDFIGNVALYHELGHFVDDIKSFSDSAYNLYTKNSGALSDEDKKKFLNVFSGNTNPPTEDMLRSYFSEYFADLFAAQYVGGAQAFALLHSAFGNQFSESHPSTDSRTTLAYTFLNNKGDGLALVHLFDEAVKNVTKNSMCLANRFQMPDTLSFKVYKPCNISNDKELHGIFTSGWCVWLNRAKYFTDCNGKPLDEVSAYKKLNELIKQSISNYIAIKKKATS